MKIIDDIVAVIKRSRVGNRADMLAFMAAVKDQHRVELVDAPTLARKMLAEARLVVEARAHYERAEVRAHYERIKAKDKTL